jgi:hypothetical protein
MADDDPKNPQHPPAEAPKLRLTFADGQVNGHYCNLAMATHTATEFLLDFAFVPPGLRDAQVLARVLMNPVNAKRFARALNENLRRYEVRFGEIDTDLGGPESLH